MAEKKAALKLQGAGSTPIGFNNTPVPTLHGIQPMQQLAAPVQPPAVDSDAAAALQQLNTSGGLAERRMRTLAAAQQGKLFLSFL